MDGTVSTSSPAATALSAAQRRLKADDDGIAIIACVAPVDAAISEISATVPRIRMSPRRRPRFATSSSMTPTTRHSGREASARINPAPASPAPITRTDFSPSPTENEKCPSRHARYKNRPPPINKTRSSGCKTKAERGIGPSAGSMTSTAGTTRADKPIATRIRFRSGKLAKRQIPLYKPKKWKVTAWIRITKGSVANIPFSCASGISKLKRSEYANTHAKAAATIS